MGEHCLKDWASVGMEVILERSTLLFCTSKLKEEWRAHLGQTVWGTGEREGAYFYFYKSNAECVDEK